MNKCECKNNEDLCDYCHEQEETITDIAGMTEAATREILGDIIEHDNRLGLGGNQWAWWPIAEYNDDGRQIGNQDYIELDGKFTPAQLLAIAWWITAMEVK